MTFTQEICNAFFNLEIEDDIHEKISERLHDTILKYKNRKASKFYLIFQKIKREVKSNPSFQGLVDLLETLLGSIKNELNLKYDIVQMFLITEILLEYSSEYVNSEEYYRLKNVAPKILAESIQTKYNLNKSEWILLMNDWIEDVSCMIQNVTVIGLILYSLHRITK